MDIKFSDDPTRYHREYYAERRQRLLDYFGDDSCAHCGSLDDLEFDHIDPALKSFDINRRMSLTPEVEAELDKCQLLCRDCHTEKTRQERLELGFTHGTTYGWMKKKCECPECLERKRQDYDAKNAKRSLGRYKQPSTHGESLHYSRGCRCPECKAARAAYNRERKQARAGLVE